jgi:hypothetical protein
MRDLTEKTRMRKTGKPSTRRKRRLTFLRVVFYCLMTPSSPPGVKPAGCIGEKPF